MTTVKYYPEEHRIEIKGHADFAPAGQDIVCAGVSTLMRTLIESVDDPDLFPMFYMNNANDAEVRVQCYPSEEKEDICKAIFDTVFNGYQALAQSYPDHVKAIGG